MRSYSFFCALLATTLGTASAHTIFQEFYVNGVDQGHEVGIRVPSYDGPITDVTSDDLICNGGINPYQQPVSQVVITVPAGSPVTTEWHHTLAGADPSDPADPIDPSHKGPLTTYLAKVPNATQTDVTGLAWFKIWEDGLQVSDQTWGVDRMIAGKGKVNFSIPSCIEPGFYLLRHEVIALHAAESYPGAQFYMECAQLEITGGGSANPATVSFPGAYHGTDPGITIDIYQTLANYTIPGPPVFSCSGGSGTTQPSSPSPSPSTSTSTSVSTVTPISYASTSTTTSTSSTKSSTTTTSTSSSASPTSTGTVAHYGQCGGTGWTGGTVCVSPYTCTYSNAYYSQCL